MIAKKAVGKRNTLYVSDLDGTLLGADSRLSSTSAAMLNELVDAGVMFTPATARTPATVQPLLQSVRQSRYIDAEGIEQPLPAIVMTGAGLWSRITAKFESCALIPTEDALNIRSTFEQEGLNPFVYCLSGDSFLNVYHTSKMSRRENAFYQERRHLELKRFHLDQLPASWGSVALFFAIGPIEAIKSASARLSTVTTCATAWYTDILLPDTGLIDIYAPGVSKAQAVIDMAQRVGAERTVVFGDNLNDLPMMAVADIAVAVENALPPVKEAADIIIGPNISDSVPREIARMEGL